MCSPERVDGDLKHLVGLTQRQERLNRRHRHAHPRPQRLDHVLHCPIGRHWKLLPNTAGRDERRPIRRGPPFLSYEEVDPWATRLCVAIGRTR